MNLKQLYAAAIQDATNEDYTGAIRKLEQILVQNIGTVDRGNVVALLGGVHLIIGEYEKGTERLIEGLSAAPNYAEGWSNLSHGLLQLGRFDEAIGASCKALALKSDYAEARHNMASALKNVVFTGPSLEISNHICRLLETPGAVHPKLISNSVISLLMVHPVMKEALKKQYDGTLKGSYRQVVADLADIKILLAFMEVCPINNIEIEGIMKNIRTQLLLNISEFRNSLDILPFQISLAMQCFINEYIYENTDLEIEAIKSLEGRVEETLINNGRPSSNELACLASYKPLYKYSWVSCLNAPIGLDSLINRQVTELNREKAIRVNIPKLEPIRDHISSKVRDQYEDNPYPRWVNLELSVSPKTLSAIAKDIELRLDNKAIDDFSEPRILIAGCGTGQHPICSARRYKGSSILAIDLSLNSLSYAKRKTEELGITNIEYMQADILDLRSLDQYFDIIECAGVLHHMKNPLEGWRVLVDCLNTGGLMNIALYSELARQHIVKTRNEIKSLNLSPVDEDMRSFRNKILNSNEEHHKLICSSREFFSMSAVRDLLFHVQEKRFTIAMIEEYLNHLGLAFCGFEDPEILRSFSLNTCSKSSAYDLNEWEQFENANPQTFTGMYQFWCQKA